MWVWQVGVRACGHVGVAGGSEGGRGSRRGSEGVMAWWSEGAVIKALTHCCHCCSALHCSFPLPPSPGSRPGRASEPHGAGCQTERLQTCKHT